MAELKASKRDALGTHKARALRKRGKVPAIIYGHGLEPLAVTLDRHDVENVVHHGERLLKVDLDGQQENVLVKDVQYDAFGQEILHLDLTRVSLDERVRVTVPILLRGTPAGAAEGGVLHQSQAQATIECVVTAIPEDIRVPVAHMKVGDVLKMSDLPLPEGATLLEDPDGIVCTVSVIAEEVAAPAEEGPAEPEVIGEKKAEEEEGQESD